MRRIESWLYVSSWQSHQHRTLIQPIIGVHNLVNVRPSCRGKNKVCFLEKRSTGHVDREHEHHLADPGCEHGLRSRSSACTCQLADQAPVFGLWAKYLGVKVSFHWARRKLPFASVVHLARDAKVSHVQARATQIVTFSVLTRHAPVVFTLNQLLSWSTCLQLPLFTLHQLLS